MTQTPSLTVTLVLFIKKKDMRYLLLTITCILSGLAANAQQEAHFVNLPNNPYILNPAAGGMSNIIQIESTSRFQWLGYNGGPRSIMLTANSPIKIGTNKNAVDEFNITDDKFFRSPKVSTGNTKHVVGGKFINDAIGPFTRTSVYGTYGIHIPISNSINLGAGLGIGYTNFAVNESRVILYEENDLAYASFLGNSGSQGIFDANAGLMIYSQRFYTGLSMSQALNNSVIFDNTTTQSNYNRHFFLMARYTVDINEDLAIEPTLVGKYVQNSPMAFDIGARVVLNQASWFGIQYRTSNAVLFQVGSNLVKNLYIAYAYEHAIGPISLAGNSTHEIQLGIYLGNNRNLKKEIKENKKEGEE